MDGYPLTRVTSADGRWVYTLYQNGGVGGYPFVHALDTVRGVAHCIGVPLTQPERHRQPRPLARRRRQDARRALEERPSLARREHGDVADRLRAPGRLPVALDGDRPGRGARPRGGRAPAPATSRGRRDPFRLRRCNTPVSVQGGVDVPPPRRPARRARRSRRRPVGLRRLSRRRTPSREARASPASTARCASSRRRPAPTRSSPRSRPTAAGRCWKQTVHGAYGIPQVTQSGLAAGLFHDGSAFVLQNVGLEKTSSFVDPRRAGSRRAGHDHAAGHVRVRRALAGRARSST